MKIGLKIAFIAFAAIVIISVLPLGIYVLVQKPALIEGAGTEDTWVAFWGSFLGGIISASLTAIVSYSILYKQQKENKKALEYKIALQNYDSIKLACIELLNAIDMNIIVDATNALQAGKAAEARDIIGDEYLKIKNAITKFYIGIETFYCRDTEKANFSDTCTQLVKRYLSFIDVIQMLMSIAANEKHKDYDISGIIKTMEKEGTYDNTMLLKIKHNGKRVDYDSYARWVTLSSKTLMKYLDNSVGEDFSRHLLIITGRFLRKEKMKILATYDIRLNDRNGNNNEEDN